VKFRRKAGPSGKADMRSFMPYVKIQGLIPEIKVNLFWTLRIGKNHSIDFK